MSTKKLILILDPTPHPVTINRIALPNPPVKCLLVEDNTPIPQKHAIIKRGTQSLLHDQFILQSLIDQGRIYDQETGEIVIVRNPKNLVRNTDDLASDRGSITSHACSHGSHSLTSIPGDLIRNPKEFSRGSGGRESISKADDLSTFFEDDDLYEEDEYAEEDAIAHDSTVFSITQSALRHDYATTALSTSDSYKYEQELKNQEKESRFIIHELSRLNIETLSETETDEVEGDQTGQTFVDMEAPSLESLEISKKKLHRTWELEDSERAVGNTLEVESGSSFIYNRQSDVGIDPFADYIDVVPASTVDTLEELTPQKKGKKTLKNAKKVVPDDKPEGFDSRKAEPFEEELFDTESDGYFKSGKKIGRPKGAKSRDKAEIESERFERKLRSKGKVGRPRVANTAVERDRLYAKKKGEKLRAEGGIGAAEVKAADRIEDRGIMARAKGAGAHLITDPRAKKIAITKRSRSAEERAEITRKRLETLARNKAMGIAPTARVGPKDLALKRPSKSKKREYLL